MGSWLSFDEFLTDDMAADVRDLDTYSPRDYRAALLLEAIPGWVTLFQITDHSAEAVCSPLIGSLHL